MTSCIFVNWATDLNDQTKNNKRNIILFVDNASCHHSLQLSNVRIEFFPPNLTSEIQPLDLGIIQSLKLQYRKRLLENFIISAELCRNCDEYSKSISILDAVKWIAYAWSKGEQDTIKSCFSKAGIIAKSNVSIDIRTEQKEDYESFMKLCQYTFQAENIGKDFINFDNSIATTNDIGTTVEEIMTDIIGTIIGIKSENTGDVCENAINNIEKSQPL